MWLIKIIAKMLAISLLPFFVVAQFLSSIFLKKYKNPLYKLQCSYELIQLKKGKTEILRVRQKSSETNGTLEQQGEDNTSDTKILLMSGNPGYVRFYDRFLTELSRELQGKIEIFAIGHLGQFNYQGKPLHNNYSLVDQIEQKTEFVLLLMQKYPNSKFVLISHSIGSYVALNVMDRVPAERILFSCKLYPVIERICATPNGNSTSKLPYFPRIYITSFIVGLLSFLPLPIKRFLAMNYLKKEPMSIDEDLSDIVEITTGYLSYSNFYSMLYMTRTEFEMLKERQTSLLEKISTKTLLYYGIDDKWCPVQYYHDIKKDMPQLNSQLDTKGFLHAFVIGGSTLKAKLIGNFLTGKLGGDLLGEL